MSRNIQHTELFTAMVQSGNYDSVRDVIDAIQEMRIRVSNGENPEEVLHEEGFEPDYFYDIIE
jgi:hypothetical protein